MSAFYTHQPSAGGNYSILREQIKQNLIKIIEFCKDNCIGKAVIYGMGDVGCTLYDAFEDSGIGIVGVMDRSQKYLGLVTNVINLGEDLKDADCIFVTTIKDEHKIVEQLRLLYSIRSIGVLSLIKGN